MTLNVLQCLSQQKKMLITSPLVILFSFLTAGCTSITGMWSSDGIAASESSQNYEDQDYTIGPEDILDISVWREETLQREVLVRPDGGISFPLAGDLQAAGRTPKELEAEITEKLRKYIPQPTVTVSVKKVDSYRIYVLGQVKKPGQYVVGRYVDVLQALTLAGGLTPFAADDNIKIMRRENGEEKIFPFSYSTIKKGKDLSQNIMLMRDDIVVVP